MATKKKLGTIIFVLALIIAGMGFYIFQLKSNYVNSTSYKSVTEVSSKASAVDSTQPKSAPVTTPKMEDGTIAPGDTKSDPLASCMGQWNTRVSKEKMEYEKGRILVGFDKGVTLDAASSVLKSYSLSYLDDGNVSDSFAAAGVLTVNVPSGTEIRYVCTLKNASHVHYTNLNQYLFLHN